ncbi:hypothetical protein C1H46_024275 [Malus baccata]|uniref:Uncharacterized protein n=1 Tax=Malus baccata TaxID=106549 RepID=A0A540LV14_MALBA|nr:hypothetical protein C1H46_024275 [Malus baccata]
MTAPHAIPSPPTSATTAPAEMDPRPVNPIDQVGPQVSQSPVSSAFSVALLVSVRRGHCRPCTPDMISASTTDASGRRQKPTRSIGRRRLFSTIRGGSKFLEIDVFADVYVRPRDDLAESFHATMMEKRQ